MLIDTHAHIYLDRFKEDLSEVIARAREQGVERIVMPAIDGPSIHEALALCDRYDGLYAMAALHPTHTKDATDADFEEVATLCDDPRVVAVGESGLDYYWDRTYDAVQEDFFRRHIRLAIEKDLSLILHLRDKQNRDEVHRDIVRLLREERNASDAPDKLRGIFHCFTGPDWLAEEAADLGFLLGLGGVLTFKNSGLDAIIRDVPLDRLVLETDAPYLAPVPYRGKRNEPSYTRYVAEKLAEVKEVSIEEIERVTTANAERLFGI
ncbi:MAG TPA: TatD family hydrolase [Rhodothermales bacterium]|nr:TatD family hydrolase [Rhodothermales bacterium]